MHRLKNPKNILRVIGLQIFTRNTFTTVEELIKGKIDVFLISKFKIDKKFPNQQFQVNGYKMIRRDRYKFGGGLIFNIKEENPSKGLSLECIPRNEELFLLYLTVENQKWLFIGLYKLPTKNEKYFLDQLSKTLGQFTFQYDKTILIADFNLTFESKKSRKCHEQF